MKRFLGWWMSAPIDEKAAVVVVVLPWLLTACVCYGKSH